MCEKRKKVNELKAQLYLALMDIDALEITDSDIRFINALSLDDYIQSILKTIGEKT